MYLIRCNRGRHALAFTFDGALAAMRAAKADVSVFNLFGRRIAGRKVMP